jgi:NTE family protein
MAGGGARGAYEAGVLAHLFESIYPKLAGEFEFDIVSGTSVGAVHAAYVAASAHMPGPQRARRIAETWTEMNVGDVLRVSMTDLLGIPLRAAGLRRLRRWGNGGSHTEVVGGLVNIAPLERLVEQRVPWGSLHANLTGPQPRALCISCTEIRSGRVTVFMDGTLADPRPWSFDPNAQALHETVGVRHVRASAAIPFLFPAVKIRDRYYVDGGLRMNTPLSPALRLGADRVLVLTLKHPLRSSEHLPAYPEEVITQPAFLLGKVLDALMLDQIEYEIHQLGLVNAWIDHGSKVYGDDFLARINEAIREQRGVDYRHVRSAVVRPSEDLGRLAATCYRERGGAASMDLLPSLIIRAALRGVPTEEADLLSYLYFDRCFTRQLVELGREDARAVEDEIVELLTGDDGGPEVTGAPRPQDARG